MVPLLVLSPFEFEDRCKALILVIGPQPVLWFLPAAKGTFVVVDLTLGISENKSSLLLLLSSLLRESTPCLIVWSSSVVHSLSYGSVFRSPLVLLSGLLLKSTSCLVHPSSGAQVKNGVELHKGLNRSTNDPKL